MKVKSVILITAFFIVMFFSCTANSQYLLVGVHSPTLTYSPLSHSYRGVHLGYDFPFLCGSEINPWGNGGGCGWIVTSADDHSKAAVAHNPMDDNVFLVRTGVWPYYDLYGYFLDYTSSDDFFNPDQFVISDDPGAQANPIITRDSVNGRFLVTWTDDRNIDGLTIYGQLVSAEEELEGSEFVIVGGLNKESIGWGHGNPYYSVAYDHVNQRFLVVWNPGASISGQFINANGTLQGEQFTIVENPDDFYPLVHTSVAYDSVNQRYLVVWDLDWGLGDIMGQLVNADGTLLGTTFAIARSAGKNPSVAFDNVNQRFLVAWTWVTTDGQFVNPDGMLQGDRLSISSKGFYSHDEPPAIAFNPQCGNFLVASVARYWPGIQDMDFVQSDIDYSIVGDPCPSATLTVKMKGYGVKRRYIHGTTGMNCIKNICSGQYWPGSEIDIGAGVDGKEVVVTWTGCDAIDSYSSCHITMDSDKNVTAKFKRAPRRKR